VTFPGIDFDESVATLIDNGSDSGAVISAGLFNMVQAKIVDWDATVLSTLTYMEGFGKVPVKLGKHVRIPGMERETSEGPIALLNVSAWVDDSDLGVGMTITRPVMNVMGYTTKGFLQQARKAQGTIDLQDISVVTSMGDSGLNKSLKKRYAEA
jgi:hypothetical protein